MYICMYVLCMYECMCNFVSVRRWACVYVCLHACLCVGERVCTHPCVRAIWCAHMCACVCAFITSRVNVSFLFLSAQFVCFYGKSAMFIEQHSTIISCLNGNTL